MAALPLTVSPPLELLMMFTTHFSVFMFVRAVCERVLPRALLGSAANWSVFYSNVNHFITLRRFEKIGVTVIMKGMKVHSCHSF
jgi:hypothetical protein